MRMEKVNQKQRNEGGSIVVHLALSVTYFLEQFSLILVLGKSSWFCKSPGAKGCDCINNFRIWFRGNNLIGFHIACLSACKGRIWTRKGGKPLMAPHSPGQSIDCINLELNCHPKNLVRSLLGGLGILIAEWLWVECFPISESSTGD